MTPREVIAYSVIAGCVRCDDSWELGVHKADEIIKVLNDAGYVIAPREVFTKLVEIGDEAMKVLAPDAVV